MLPLKFEIVALGPFVATTYLNKNHIIALDPFVVTMFEKIVISIDGCKPNSMDNPSNKSCYVTLQEQLLDDSFIVKK
jgi:hypothetical protein